MRRHAHRPAVAVNCHSRLLRRLRFASTYEMLKMTPERPPHPSRPRPSVPPARPNGTVSPDRERRDSAGRRINTQSRDYLLQFLRRSRTARASAAVAPRNTGNIVPRYTTPPRCLGLRSQRLVTRIRTGAGYGGAGGSRAGFGERRRPGGGRLPAKAHGRVAGSDLGPNVAPLRADVAVWQGSSGRDTALVTAIGTRGHQDRDA